MKPKNFKKNIIYILMIPFIFGLVVMSLQSGVISAINLRIIKKPILTKEMMKGYNLEDSRIYEREPGDDPDDPEYAYLEAWRRKENRFAQVRFRIMVYKSRKDAIRYGEFQGSTGKGWKDGGYFGKGFGDKHWIYLSKSGIRTKSGHIFTSPIYLVFVKGNIVVHMGGNGPYGDPPSESHESFEKVARYIESKI